MHLLSHYFPWVGRYFLLSQVLQWVPALKERSKRTHERYLVLAVLSKVCYNGPTVMPFNRCLLTDTICILGSWANSTRKKSLRCSLRTCTSDPLYFLSSPKRLVQMISGESLGLRADSTFKASLETTSISSTPSSLYLIFRNVIFVPVPSGDDPVFELTLSLRTSVPRSDVVRN